MTPKPPSLPSHSTEDQTPETLTQVEGSVAYLSRVLGVDTFLLPVNFDPSQPLESDLFNAAESAPISERSVANDLVEDAFVSGHASRTARAIGSVGPDDAALVFLALDGCEGSLWSGESGELLERMILAMKQDPASVLRISMPLESAGDALARLASVPRAAVVVLGVPAALALYGGQSMAEGRWLEDAPGGPALITHSLDEVIRDNGLKRPVWQHLQTVMKRLSVS